MRYGFFDDERREYVITQPDTPLPWINYLGNRDYFGLISNTAGGYSFYRDARLRRLTRYRYNNVPFDLGGRYIYLRDNDANAFWSPTWQPTQSALDDYECRHGLGYTIISSTCQRIHSSIRYFVPLDDNLEVWQLSLTNLRDTPAHLSIFSLVEFCLWDANDDATNYQRNFNTGEVEIVDEVIYHKTEYRERRNHFAFFACSEPLAGFDTQREEFFGAYRGWHNPFVVERGESCNSIAHGWQPIGSQQVRVMLAPNESKQIIFLLGYHENPQTEKFDPPNSQTINKRTVKPLIAKYLDAKNVDAAFDELHEHWNKLLGIYSVQTPDVHTNQMVNIWNAYQCMVTFNLSRSASFYESGIGRGMGFRDSNQDLLGFVQMVPERARERILDIAATQLETGGAYHQYQPLTKRGNDGVGSNFNDDPLWLILGVAAYLKETGDWSILDERVPYDNRPGSETALYEHLQRSIKHTLDRLGPHGLPLIGRADWNDCLNLNCFSDSPGESFQTTTNKDGKIAESVMIAGLFVYAAKEMSAIAERCGRASVISSEARNLSSATRDFSVAPLPRNDSIDYLAIAEKMAATILQHGWDGEWFLRAYDDSELKVGSHENAEGKIFVESQGWCVIAGVGVKDGYAARALESVGKYLATPHGIVLQQPAFSKYYLNLGEISSYPPGYKENASVFCHTNPWIMIAESLLGHGDRAHDYYSRINPSAREAISDIHRCEPYVYAQTIAGRDAPTHGEAKNSWLTGTAAWNFVAITQYILGIRPTFDGLQVAPAIPRAWKSFSATRIFRGVTFYINVERAGNGNAVSLVVDGKAIEGNIVPLPTDGRTQVNVSVTIR
ncbi:MAG: glycosyl transferase [Chloroflexi bacterium]|nr:glycosyl transferase [Chloroflexota bacterium]